jgi:hypothetical protein
MQDEVHPAVVFWAIMLTLGSSSFLIAFFVRRRPRLLQFLANFTVVYPLVVISSVHGQWFLSWFMLGHRPVWSDDDPAFISGASWMHLVTTVVLLGIVPVACAACIFNVAYIYQQRPSAAQASIRLYSLLGFWMGMIAWLIRDPHGIMEWWLD